MTAYSGQVEGMIRPKVADEVQGETVNVVITSDADVLTEQGQMAYEQGWW